MAMERYVYVLNSDKYSNENIDLAFADKGNAFPATAFSSASVNPIIKSTNIAAEHSGVSANFFEIRSGPYDGMISADNSGRIVNRIYPTANATTITAYAKNRQQTRSYKIRTYSAKSSETHNSKVIGSGGLDINLDTNDYFVLINPEIDHTETDGTTNSDTHSLIRPHFARITQILSYDTYGDGFEFEPKYTGPISKDTNFEIYKGPAATDTDVVAVSYGLRGDGNEINPTNADDTNFAFITDKYDASSQVSKPTWYFYNDRLQNKDQLDYDTKYNLTTCRWFDWASKGAYTNVAGDTQYTSNISLITSSNFLLGQSVYYKNNSNEYIYMGNVTADASLTITLDYARNALLSTSSTNDDNLYVGRTIHQTVFRTEREYGDEIQDLGPRNQHATLVDKMHDNDTIKTDYETESTYTFNPSIWKDAFRNHKRTTNDLKSSASGYTTAGTISTLHANLTGPKRYLYYKSSHLKNNAVIPVTELRVNNPKEKISQIARVKTLDGSGIQFLKLKEDADLVVTKAIHTNTLKEFKLPYYADSNYESVGPVFSIVLKKFPKTEVDYGGSASIKANDIIRVNNTYYRVSTVSSPASNEQYINVSHKKLSDVATWSALSSESDMETFTGADAYVMAWNGGLNSSCPIDSEGVYTSNTLQRLTMHGNTISLKDNSLYNKKISLLNPEFYGHDITINYGDSLHNHIKLKSTKKFYQPDSERIDFMYYYNGNYAVEEEAFSGTIEDIESSSSEGMLTYTITGRDKTSILLNNLTNNNLNKTDDIVYSTLAPVFDAPTTTVTRYSMTNAGVLTLTGTVAVEKHDLFLNSNGELIGEAVSDTPSGSNTAVTLGGFDYTRGGAGTNTLYHIKFAEINYLTGTKAMATNLDASKYPTDYSSVGEKGVVFHDGERITYSEPTFSYTNLLNTSSIGSFNTNRTIGYDITDVKGIVESYDSNFAFKLSNETAADITYNHVHTVAMSNYDVVDFDSHNTGVTLKVAPKFPIVLGSVDTNTSDDNWGTDMRYLYTVNSNIPSGGFIHTLNDTHTNYYTPKNTFRYWGMQKFIEGTIKETHDSIYDNSEKTQRITAAMPMYKINALGTKSSAASDLTPTLKPKSGSNFWTGTDMGLTDRAAPIEYWDSSEKTTHWNQLENIDYRAKNYELLAIGDIYPDSKLRWNNIQAQTKDFSTYGMILESAGSEGKSISHENFTGTTNNTNTSDSNYERVEITSSNKTTTQLKRFGIMRLVEATFDWHMNPIDYESIANNDDYDKITNFKYPRMKILYNALVDTYSAGNTVSFDTITNASGSSVSSMTLLIGDIIYRADGTILGKVNAGINAAEISISLNSIILYGDAPVSDEKVYIIRQKLFPTIADTDFGINTLGTNPFRMLNTYIVLPNIRKDYFKFGLLELDGKKYDCQNILIPLISDIIELDDPVSPGEEDFISLFHEAKRWDSNVNSSTLSTAWFTPSKIIYGLAKPTYIDSGTPNERKDPIQYKIGNSADIYGRSMMMFKNMKKSMNGFNSEKLDLPTSAALYPGTYGTDAKYALYGNEQFHSQLDQMSPNLTLDNNVASGDGTNIQNFAICGVKTERHIWAAPDGLNREWAARYEKHDAVSGHNGGLFQAQTVIKPRLTLPTTNDTSFTLTMNNDIQSGNPEQLNLWLDFVPNLEGYYLVSEKMDDKYIPSLDNSDIHATTGIPDYIGKITSHATGESGGYTTHTITLDKTLTTNIVGTSFRLMRVSETTFENTPNFFEVNKMFDVGLQYSNLHQNYITGTKEESGEPALISEEADSDVSFTDYRAYQQGLYSMYLLLDVDNFNTHIDRRSISDIHSSFADGDSLNCYITDGKNTTEYNLIINRTTDSLRFSYDGELTGYGVVSFGETFTIETPEVSRVRNPKTAYIGTSFSIGTDAELAIEEMLEENGIEVDTSEKQLNYTSNIVNADTTGSNIDIVDTLVGVEVGEIIYNQDGKLIGKTVTPASGADITIEDIFYQPKKNDEITKYSRKPHILNTNFTDQDIFSAINYLAAKKSLDYNFDEDNIKIRDLDNYNTHRKFALKYRDGTNLISVDSNTSLFDKASKIIVIGDNVRAEVEEPAKKTRTMKHIDSNIKNSQEARIKAYSLLELHNKSFRKIQLTLEKTGFELMKAGDLISLDFPNHNIPADDYIVFEIENVMSNIAKITVGTFNKTIAERLSELGANQGKGFTNLFSKNTTKTLTARVLFDDIKMKEQSLNYEHKTVAGGTTFGFV